MRDIGYDSFNLFMNLGTLAFLCCLYLLKVVIVILILKPASYFSSLAKSLYKTYYRQVFFGDLFAIFVEGYMEFLISSAFLILVAPEESVDWVPYQVNTAYVCLFLALALIPSIYLFILTRPLKRYQTRLFRRRWGILVKNVNSKFKINMFFPFWFILQRILYIGTAFFIKKYGALQIMALNYIGLFSIIYFGNNLPLIGRLANNLEFANHFFVLLSYLHLFCFTDWVQTEEDKYVAGWSLIIVIILKMLINLILFANKAFRDIYLISKKYYILAKFYL